MSEIEKELMSIEAMIYVIRGHRVMLDSDLAKLYGTETGALNRQVKRNINRFPADFMVQLTENELENLRCQIGISSSQYGGRRYLPFAFTENGVAMLSSVLNSERAIEMNISIMRIFTKLRSFHALESNLAIELKDFKENTNKIFKVVVHRKKIGLKHNS